MKPYTVITGASTGLGKAFALACARRGMNLLLIALPGSNIRETARHLQQLHKTDVRWFEADLANPTTLMELASDLAAKYSIQFLINNAGIGGTSPMSETPPESIDSIIMLNVRGTVMLTRMLIPALQQHSRSYILNVSSMAAFMPIAYKTVYPASKAFISSFSLGMREELSHTGVSVSVLYPGPLMTNSSSARRILSHSSWAKLGLMPVDKMAGYALQRALDGQGAIIPGWFNRLNHAFMQWVPPEIKLRLVSREVRKELIFGQAGR
jgi:short-subunit dehydrogenase